MKMLLLFLISAIFVFTGNAEPGKSGKVDKDISQLISSATWKYDQDNVKNRSMRFRNDGSVEATTWKGLWKATGAKTVEITLKDKRKALLEFNEDYTRFTGVGFDKMEMRGRRVGDVPSSLK